MRQFLAYGSVRGVTGNGRPYREPQISCFDIVSCGMPGEGCVPFSLPVIRVSSRSIMERSSIGK